jgi:hypothetical protein
MAPALSRLIADTSASIPTLGTRNRTGCERGSDFSTGGGGGTTGDTCDAGFNLGASGEAATLSPKYTEPVSPARTIATDSSDWDLRVDSFLARLAIFCLLAASRVKALFGCFLLGLDRFRVTTSLVDRPNGSVIFRWRLFGAGLPAGFRCLVGVVFLTAFGLTAGLLPLLADRLVVGVFLVTAGFRTGFFAGLAGDLAVGFLAVESGRVFRAGRLFTFLVLVLAMVAMPVS